MPLRMSGFRCVSWVALTMLWVSAAARLAVAVDYNWKSGVGGSGTWDTTTTNWTTSGTVVSWPTSGTDNAAIFGTASGTVAVSGSVAANAITTSVTGYVLGGSGTIGLNGTTPTINVTTGVLTIGNASSGPVLAGSAGLTKAGSGTATLSGTAVHTFTGGISVTGGELGLDFTNLTTTSNLVASSNTLSLTGGRLYVNGTTSISQTFAGLSVGAGVSQIETSGGTGKTISVQVGAASRSDVAAVWGIKASGIIGTTAPSTNKVFVSTPSAFVGSWAFVNDVTGTNAMWAYAGSNGQVFGNRGSAVSGSLSTLTSATTAYSLSASGTLTGSGTAFGIYSGTSAAGATATLSTGNFQLTTNGFIAPNGTLTVTRTGAGGVTVGSQNELVIAGAGNVTISAPIANLSGSSSNLTYAGGGTLTLDTAASTYTGLTTVYSGSVVLGLANVLNSSSGIVINGGAVDYGSNSQSVASLRLTAGTLAGTSGALSVASGSIDVRNGTVSGILGGAAGLAKTTTGTVTLSGANTYGGATTVSAGILNVTNGSALGSSVAGTTISDGARIVLSGSITVANEPLTLTGAGNNNGALQADAGTNTWGGPITLSGSPTLGNRVGGNTATTTLRLTGAISGDGPFIVRSANASAIVEVSGSGNSYTGGSSVYSGVLRLAGGNDRLPTSGTLTMGATSLIGTLDLGGFNQAFSGIAVGATSTQESQTIGNSSTTSDSTLTVNLASGTNTYVGKLVDSVSGGTRKLGLTKLGGGTLIISGTQNTYSGTTDVQAGTLRLAGSLAPATAVTISATNAAVFDLNGRNQSISSLAGGAATNGQVLLGSGTLTVTGGDSTTFAGSISGAGGLVKGGAGVLTLAGNSTYAGPTAVNAGTLAVNGSIASAVSVAAGATLSGTGSVSGATTVLGTLSPGDSPGVLTLASLVLDGASASLFEITGAARGTAYDGVTVTQSGGLTYGGSLSLSFTSTFGDNTTFDLFDFIGASAGSFSSVTASGPYGSLTFTNDGFGVWTSGSTNVPGQTMTFTQSTGDLAIVPEPGALVLAGLGIAAACGLIRRKSGSK